MDKQLHLLETFRAQDPAGAMHTVRAYEHLVRVMPTTDPFGQWEPTGVVEYRLDDGRPLRLARDGVLHSIDTDEAMVPISGRA